MAGGLVKTALTGMNIGDGINAIVAVSDYKNAREQGNSKAVSVAKAAGSFAWGEMFFGGVSGAITKAGLTGGAAIAANVGVMAAYIGVTAGTQAVVAMGNHNAKQMAKRYNSKGKFGSGYFDMTEAGYTMRQRSLNAIRNNGLNTQSALGNEARNYFRGSF